MPYTFPPAPVGSLIFPPEPLRGGLDDPGWAWCRLRHMAELARRITADGCDTLPEAMLRAREAHIYGAIEDETARAWHREERAWIRRWRNEMIDLRAMLAETEWHAYVERIPPLVLPFVFDLT